MDLYVEALSAELAQLGAPQTVETLFLGGGTPTHLDCPTLDRLLTALDRWLPRSAGSEFSVEANPESLDADRIDILAAHGVNRVSLGVQSFHAETLRVLERQHDPASVPVAVERARQCIRQLSLDLIFGVPGQTLDSWNADLDQALALQPDHLSTYGLTFEKGTRLWKQRQRQEIRSLDEDSERAFYVHAIDKLTNAGFEHYEISNYARPEKRSRHNQVYWANEAYFGFGMGAARYIQGRREVNTRNLQDFIRRALAGLSPTFQSEELNPEERARETLVLQLRRSDGIDRQQFREQTGFGADELAKEKLVRLVELGLLQDNGERVWMTVEGKCVADALASELL